MTSPPETRFINLFKQLSNLPLLHLPEDVELSMPAITLLSWVFRSPGCGVLDIAKGLQLSPPTISVGIRRLIKGGWLERGIDPTDRRAHPLYLTPSGDALMKRVRDHRTQMLRIFLSGLTVDEQEQLLELLDRGLVAVEESMQTNKPH